MGASSSSSAAAREYDVFISFRGEDTRHNFTSHLDHALRKHSIKAFIDKRLNKGDDLSPSLSQAIQNSYGSLVVFSENYAASKWCLNELLEILKCRKHGHFVIPVFYKIDPSHVRKQTGSYAEAFAKHEQDSNNSKTMSQKWKAALTEAANIVGWDSQSRNNRDESELIQNVVNNVLQKLDHIYQLSELGLVGIDKRCEHIEALLRKAPVVGIWGMGGIGKTTIAKAIFSKLSSQYDSCCFLENVREKSQNIGLDQLHDKLLCELIKDDIFSINPHKVVGLKHAMRRLSNKKVFIVLDDVSDFELLEHLAQEHKVLGPESRVIITTRDKHLLTSLGDKCEIHPVNGLNDKESFKLFRSSAFNENYPEIGYEEITEKFVHYTQGNPLALKVLGSFLLSKSREEWESAWKKLKKIPNEKIEKVLRLSFDGLNHEDQQIFLDIACFLKGKNKEEIIRLCDFYGVIGIRTLQDRALITLSYNNIVQMHDLIQKMGWEIVRKECIQEPGRRSRLWDPEETYEVLKYNKGTEAIQGIILDMSQIKDLHLSVDPFKKMTNLRFLKFYSNNHLEPGKIHLLGNIQQFSDKLRYFHWNECPLPSLPSTFCAEKLVNLKMPFSNIKKLWDGVQNLTNLKNLDLHGSEQLIELPDFSKASNLESVKLSFCTNLCHIHPSVLSLHTLKTLNIRECIKLRSLQSEVHLQSLEDLEFDGCSSLKEFSLTSEKIRSLDIIHTAVEMLDSSIGCCSNLEILTVFDSLVNLHIAHESFPSLREIILIDCPNLSQLPDNIRYLSCLIELEIENCPRLLNIPELPPSISELRVNDCTSLETITTPKPFEHDFLIYRVTNCVKLDEHSLSRVIELFCLRIKQATLCKSEKWYTNKRNSISISFPGNSVPSWFIYRAAKNWISIEIPPCSHLLGFAFYCIVSSEFLLNIDRNFSHCGCCCTCLKNCPETYTTHFMQEWSVKLNSDHVCIWSIQDYSYDLFDLMEEQRAKGQSVKKLSFEFFVMVEKKGQWLKENGIKECGVWPIYASEYDNSINELEERMGIKLGYRSDDIDERVEVQFDELGAGTSATGFTSSVSDLRDQDISTQNANLCLLNRDRFNKLDYSTSQMELNLELGISSKRKRCQDMDNHQPLQRKKINICSNIDELLGGVGTSGIGVGCSEFDLQPLVQTNTMNESVFQPLSTDISLQNASLDSTQLNFTCLLERFSEFGNSVMQFGQIGFSSEFDEMATDGNSFDIDQQSLSLSPWLNQGHPQMNPFDIRANSGPYASSSSSGLPDIVQMAQANNVFGSSSLWLNQGHPQMNPFNIGANFGPYASSSSSGLPDIAQMAQANNVFNFNSFWLNQGHPPMNPFDIRANFGPYTSSSSSGFPDMVQMAQSNNVFGSSSLWLNQGHSQMFPFDIGASSGPHASSGSSGLPDIVQMAQANNVYGFSSFCLNLEDPQMNLLEGIKVGGSHQENQHEQEQFVIGNGIDRIHLPFTSCMNPDAE